MQNRELTFRFIAYNTHRMVNLVVMMMVSKEPLMIIIIYYKLKINLKKN